MTRFLHVEVLKLRRSLALLLVVTAPLCVAMLSGFIALGAEKPREWFMFSYGTAALWAFFMLPMSVTALTVLMGQMEHGPRTWNHLLALPVPRAAIFLSKAVVLFGLVALMMIMLFVATYAAGAAANMIKPGALSGPIEPSLTARLLTKMFAGSLLMCVIQLWAALRFRSFVPPLVLGIAGTLVAVAATSASQGAYFPWLLPVQALPSQATTGTLSLTLGCVGGLALLVVMVLDLSRRDA
jgi:lantibiotic transport system permease protein